MRLNYRRMQSLSWLKDEGAGLSVTEKGLCWSKMGTPWPLEAPWSEFAKPGKGYTKEGIFPDCQPHTSRTTSTTFSQI